MSKKCEKDAAFRYTWPGRDESFICTDHAPKLKAVASAMGLPLQLIPIDDEGTVTWRQEVS
jgi:hypothetical protein